MTSRLVSPTVIGRGPELAAIDQALAATVDGRPAHLLVAGEAGIGKSRLVAEATARAAALGMRTVAGGCANVGEGGLPFGPVIDILRALARELPAAELAALVDPARADLARLLPALADEGDPARDAGEVPALTGTQQARLFDAVLGLVHRLAAAQPALLVIEDLHWADPATRDLVAYLVRHLRTDRALLVMTFRSDELHRRHPLLPWLAELERTGHVDRVDLVRLDPGRTGELLTAILGEAVPAGVVDRIHQRSDGNPFFVEELLMADQDAPGGPSGAARLPPTLRQVLIARIAALPDAAQAVVGVAAVAGRHVDHDLLARVAAMDDDVLLDALRTAVGRQVLVTGVPTDRAGEDGYAFRHALLQEAAYEDLLPGERQRLHRAFASALDERLPGSGAVEAGHWAELAHHWSAARDDRQAFAASIRAGQAAASAYAFADALRHDERALGLWDSVADPEATAGIDRAALLARAATAAWLSGDSHRAVALRREAVAAVDPASDPVRAGTLLEQLGRAYWNDGDTDAALAANERAVATIPAEPPTAERARVLAGYGQLLMLLDRWEDSEAMCQEAVDLAQRVGALAAEGHARNTLGLDYAAQGRCADAVASLRTALAIALDLGDADDVGRAYVNLSEALRDCGDVRGSLAVVEEGIAVADGMGMVSSYGAFARQNGILVAMELGDWDRARRFAEASALNFRAGRQAERYLLSHWVPFLVAIGDARASDRLDALRSMVEGYAVETQFNAPFRFADAEQALWQGDPARALVAARTGIDELERTRYHRYHLRLFRSAFRALGDLADIARARRDGEALAAVQAADAELAGILDGLLERWRARLHGQDQREPDAESAIVAGERERVAGRASPAVWAAAVAACERRQDPYARAYARWRAGEAHLQLGDRAAATAALADVASVARDLGALPLLAAVDGLAARARLDLASGVGSGGDARADEASRTGAGALPADPFGLTRRERDVLPLLIQGRTNRQIADELFISESTAGVHVSNILGKLGATSRTEAATIAVRLGLDREG